MQVGGVTLQKLLFEPTLVRSPLRVVQWWESRRLTYNAIVGGLGAVSLAWMFLLVRVMADPGPLEWEPFVIGPIVYGLAANICYTSGSIVEMLVERWLKRPAYGLGPALFRYGLVFSIGLTLLPAGVMTVAAALALVFGGS